MLDILLIKKTNDFFRYLSGVESTDPIIVVTPNPQTADLVRNRCTSIDNAVESVTISKYIKDELNALIDPERLDNYRGKSELLLLLGAIWKKVGSEKNFVAFKKAFNLLTEFRSFSMSDHVLETVLEHYDEQAAADVMWLHRFLNEMDIIDEHRSYFLLSERLREGELPPSYKTERKIVFYGFDFLTGSQVDLLKAISLRDDVLIPFYEGAFATAQNLDWIKWLEEQGSNIQEIFEEGESEKEIPFYAFPKNYFSKGLAGLQDQTPDSLEVVLGTKNLTHESILEVPFNDYKAKVPIDIFGDDFFTVMHEVEEMVLPSLNSESLKENLLGLVKKYSEIEDYRKIKPIFVLLNKINDWESLSSENSEIEEFDLRILKESAALDLPRVNYTTVGGSELIREIKSLKNLDEVKNQNVVLGINSNHGPVKSSGAVYSENVEKYLTSIGPIRRGEFELAIFKERLNEFLVENEVLILMEEGLLEHDISWSAIFQNKQLKHSPLNLEFKKQFSYPEQEIDHTSLKSISASRMQKYIECPQKFYLQSILKIVPEINIDTELNPMELGQLEHKVIELFFEQNKEFDEEKVIDLVLLQLDEYCKNKNISSKKKEEHLIEAKAFCLGTINELFSLKASLGGEFSFEKEFKVNKDIFYSGSIDCFIQGDDFKAIIDFKRSNRVFTSFKSIQEFEQIQLWFYLKRLEELQIIDKEENLIFGYIDLSDLTNSMLFTNSKELLSPVKKSTSFSKLKVIDDLPQSIDDYTDFEENVLSSLKNDQEFKCKPLDKDSCGFCPVKNICPRG